MLALCGQVPLAELGTDYFQEVDNDALFADVAVFRHTITSPEQLPNLLERAVQSALTERGVAVLTLPGDVGELDLPKGTPRGALHRPAGQGRPGRRGAARGRRAASTPAGKVTLLVGIGAREARAEVLALAEKLAAPMVLTLKAKEGLERDNPFQVGQTGLIGNPAARHAFDDCDLLLMLGTDFPYSRLVSRRARSSCRSTPRARTSAAARRSTSGVVGDAGARRAPRCSTASQAKPDREPPRGRHRALRRVARRAAQARRPRLRGDGRDPQAAREARQPGPADPPRGARRRGQHPRRPRRDLHRRHRHVDRLALALRRVHRHAPADRLVQPRLDGQRAAAGARRAGPRHGRAR